MTDTINHDSGRFTNNQTTPFHSYSGFPYKDIVRFVLKNPLFTAKLVFYKFKLFWHLNRDISLPALQYFFVFIFATYGSIISFIKIKTVSILYLLPIFFTIMSMIFWGDDRIRSPIDPILVIFAACGIHEILRREKTGNP